MKTKIRSIIVATITVVAGYVVSNPLMFHICTNIYQFGKETGCLDDIVENVGTPLFTFSLWALFAVIVTAFFSEKIFKSWLKFAAWAIPLAIVFIWTTHVNFTGIGMDFFPFYRDDAARLAGEVFTAISLILIAYRAFRSARTK